MEDEQSPVLEERGLFWWADEPVPNGHFAPESAVNGHLTITHNGWSRLELDHQLARDVGPLEAAFEGIQEPGATKDIAGQLIKGARSILLRDVRKSGAIFSSYGPSTERFRATICLVGARPFPSSDIPLTVGNIEISLQGFEPWFRRQGIAFQRVAGTFAVAYTTPPQRTYELAAGDLTLRFFLEGPGGSGGATHFELREVPLLAFAPKQPIALDDAATWAHRLEDLLVLLTNLERQVGWPKVTLVGLEEPITLYRAQERRPNAELSWNASWVDYTAIEEQFGGIVEQWLVQHERFGPGFHLYLGTRRGSTLFVEHRFANLIWGLESLHRRSAAETKDLRTSDRMARITAQIANPADRKWIVGKLKYAGEPPLADRLRELLSELPFRYDRKVFNRFVERCATRRNDVSHFGGARSATSYPAFIEELQKLSEVLDRMYHAIILKMIGVPDDVLVTLFEDRRPPSGFEQIMTWAGYPLLVSMTNPPTG